VVDDVAEAVDALGLGERRRDRVVEAGQARRVDVVGARQRISVSGWRVAFSIDASMRRSRGVTKLIASPERPRGRCGRCGARRTRCRWGRS
jgi:hypothetical protein